MIRFRTEIEVPEAPFRLKADRPVLFIGSCFSDNIGGRLLDCMAPAPVNPCGVQFNPASIAQVIECALDNNRLPDDLFFHHDGLWRCWLLPTAFAAAELQPAIDKADEALRRLRESLKEAQALVVTFGTAQVYRHMQSTLSSFEGIVSNCHKVPAKEFSHEMLSVDDISRLWLPLIERLKGFNPSLRFIFTVSPVRHLNPSPRLNTLSKATLHLAVDQLVAKSEDTIYFPAWELLMDDLRDYRFYAKDLTHPSDVAVDYIWQHFVDTFYDDSQRRLLAEGASRHRRLSHRPILP